MIFNFDECALLISSLETYDDQPRGLFPDDVQHRFAETITKKINNLSPLTYFTKQEYTFMAVSVQHIIKCYSKLGDIPDSAFFALRDKLLTLAEPSDT